MEKQLDNTIINKNKILEIINSIKDTNNFKIAFTHRSARFLDPKNELHESYERLEFFGDSLLEYYTTYFLFKSFPKHSEGDLTQLRSQFVERKNLAKISKSIGLDNYLVLNTNYKPEADKTIKILADIFESFVGALYLEKGENVLHEFLSLTLFNRPETTEYLKDYKLNSLLVSKALTNTNLNSNSIAKSSEDNINKLTLNLITDNKETTNNLTEQIKILNKISNALDAQASNFQNSIKQIIVEMGLQKDIISDINVWFHKLKTILDQNKLDIHMELKHTNKFLYELNNSVLNVIKELAEAQVTKLRILKSVNIIIPILILIVCILAIITIKLIFMV